MPKRDSLKKARRRAAKERAFRKRQRVREARAAKNRGRHEFPN